MQRDVPYKAVLHYGKEIQTETLPAGPGSCQDSSAAELAYAYRGDSGLEVRHRLQPSHFSPRATIDSAPSGSGR